MPTHTHQTDDTGEIARIDDDAPATENRPYPPSSADEPQPDPDRSRKPLLSLNLSLSQIIGGSLAAATAAALGSKLGTAGTIGGAALASVTTAVAGSLYTASVHRTRESVRKVWSRRGAVPAVDPDAQRVLNPMQRSQAAAAASEVRDKGDHAGRPGTGSPAKRVVRPRNVVLGALAIFLVASIGIFGYETLTGHALDGQQGTTIGHVVGSSSSREQPTKSHRKKPVPSTSATPSSPSTSQPSSDSSPGPSDVPTTSPTSGPSSGGQGSSSGSSAPSAAPTGGATTGQG